MPKKTGWLESVGRVELESAVEWLLEKRGVMAHDAGEMELDECGSRERIGLEK